jgi:hypothetical protein
MLNLLKLIASSKWLNTLNIWKKCTRRELMQTFLVPNNLLQIKYHVDSLEEALQVLLE